MVIDTSAVLAIAFEEPFARALSEKIVNAEERLLPSSCYVEAAMVLTRTMSDPQTWLSKFLQVFSIEVADLSQVMAQAAVEAFIRFGKGRHRAGLNFGDCLAYGTARVLAMPLLFVGDDFANTDLDRA